MRRRKQAMKRVCLGVVVLGRDLLKFVREMKRGQPARVTKGMESQPAPEHANHMPDILTCAVLEQPKNAGAYLPWVKELIARVKNEDPDGLRKIRLCVGLAKELMQEAFPIGLFASRYFAASNEVEIALKVGSQGYDATVRDLRDKPSGIAYLEVTMATDGEVDYLRMLELHRADQVSGLGLVTKTGTKRTGLTIQVRSEAVSQQSVLEKERRVVLGAIERKVTKNYPAGTALIVGFDDTMSFDRADNIANIENVLDANESRLSSFHTVAVVGLIMNTFLVRSYADAT
tara:strand:+ start:84 stop:947 length:864 start_codon:yes stop_codon:yes gene_type:complete